ncbi:hypothetical protein [Microbacterium sp. NPDC055683]
MNFHSVRRAFTRLANPVLLASVFSSVCGALLMLIASLTLDIHEFSGFSLVYLVLTLCLGLIRAGLFQPAMIYRRREPATLVPWSYALLSAAGSVPIFFAVSFPLQAVNPWTLAAVSIAIIIPVLFEWAKHRQMSAGSNVRVAVAEAARLVIVPGALAAGPSGVGGGIVVVLLVLIVGYALGLLILLGAFPRIATGGTRVGFARYRREAFAQAGDFGVAQMLSSVPLLIAGMLMPGAPLIGAIRLAQTIFGPLNVLFGAITNVLMVRGARDGAETSDAQLRGEGRRLGFVSLALALMVTAIAFALVATGAIPPGVAVQSMPIAVGLVGAVAVAASWAGMQMMVMRLMGHAGAVFRRRLVVVVATTIGYLVGWMVGGLETSLIAGFLLQAVALLAAFPLLKHSRRPGHREGKH